MKHNVLLLLCILWFGTFLSAQIDSTVQAYLAEHSFSGTILVADPDSVLYQQSFGQAYRQQGIPIENDYHYSIASVTKLFTAICILRLREGGSLRLEDPVSRLLPELSIPNGDQITVHHLLLHLSGLPNEPDRLYRAHLSPVAFTKEVLKARSKNTLGQFNYNNLDYVLLGLIIEQQTTKAWSEVVKEQILDPLGLQQTGFLEYGYYPDRFAYTYSAKKNGTLVQDPLFAIENFYAAGCMYATATDLLKLDRALYTDKLLSSESRALLAKSYPEYNYAGYSVWNYPYPFLEPAPTIMERRGMILGANVVLVRLTDQHRTIIILSNTNQFNPDSFGDPTNLREALIRVVAN